MVIKISTKTSDDRGIPVIVDDETIRYIKNPEALKLLQLLLEDLNDSRKEVEEKEELIEQLLNDEQEQDDWAEIERENDEWFKCFSDEDEN